MRAPVAIVTSIVGTRVHVRCPYCQAIHAHPVRALGRTEHRAPACGLYRSEADRLNGYTFTTPAPAGNDPKEIVQ